MHATGYAGWPSDSAGAVWYLPEPDAWSLRYAGGHCLLWILGNLRTQVRQDSQARKTVALLRGIHLAIQIYTNHLKRHIIQNRIRYSIQKFDYVADIADKGQKNKIYYYFGK